MPFETRRSKTGGRVRWLLVGVGLLAVLLPAAAVVASTSVRDYLYRELSYQVVTNRIVGQEQDPERIALRLNQFIAENVYPGNGPTLDTNAWNDLVRGVGWCDQDAWLLGTLLATRDIPGRFVMLNADTGGAVHTMAEVQLGGTWRVFDPLFGLVFPQNGQNGSLATLADLVRDPSVVTSHPAVQALPHEVRTKTQQFYADLLSSSSAKDPTRWAPLTDAKYGTRPRRAVRTALRIYLSLFGAWGANRFQDLHMALLPDRLPAFDAAMRAGNRPVLRTAAEDPALFLYFRARNYHLYERASDAERLYREIIDRYPDAFYAQMSDYFLGQLEFGLGQFQQALDQFSTALERYPNAGLGSQIHDAMGRIYEARGELDKAVEHYRLAQDDPMTTAAYRLAQLAR